MSALCEVLWQKTAVNFGDEVLPFLILKCECRLRGTHVGDLEAICKHKACLLNKYQQKVACTFNFPLSNGFALQLKVDRKLGH